MIPWNPHKENTSYKRLKPRPMMAPKTSSVHYRSYIENTKCKKCPQRINGDQKRSKYEELDYMMKEFQSDMKYEKHNKVESSVNTENSENGKKE